ncbi:ABC-type enterobactin transport system permease subunit [Pseudomonas sp. PvP001]
MNHTLPAPTLVNRYRWRVYRCAALLALVMLASLLLGAGDTGPWRALSTLLGQGSSEERFVLFQLRWSRTLLGLLVGAALVRRASCCRRPRATPWRSPACSASVPVLRWPW